MEEVNRAHAIAVQQSLRQMHAFADLEARTSELIELCEECTAVGLNLAELAARLEALCNSEESDHQAKRQRGAASARPLAPLAVARCC